MTMDAEAKAEWEQWLASRPPAVAAVARRFPPDVCYRSPDGRGHYVILTYGEPKDGGPVTFRVIHGADSFHPGLQVFGMEQSDLLPCNCGNWEMASEEQIEETSAKVDAIAKAMHAQDN
jgi:hypothetical protein